MLAAFILVIKLKLYTMGQIKVYSSVNNKI